MSQANYRFAGGRYDRIPAIPAGLVSRKAFGHTSATVEFAASKAKPHLASCARGAPFEGSKRRIQAFGPENAVLGLSHVPARLRPDYQGSAG